MSGGGDDLVWQLEQEIAELRERIGVLVNEVIDLRASALLWGKLYEDAWRRLKEYEKPATTLKPRHANHCDTPPRCRG